MNDTLFSTSDGIDPEVVEAARTELAKKLPELRKLPGFPIGSDEDILKMSVPPYYTACPNPFIEDWLEASAPDGYEDREYVDPGPYASDVSAGKTHPVYRAHAYWTKVPHEIIMRYILHYTQPGDVVLDGFAGTGMTGVAAQACGVPEPKIKSAIEVEMGSVEWGARRAVLQDLAPVASFIAAGVNLPFDADAFDEASQRILDEFEAEWGWMYETTHTDGSKARIDYTVWSEVFTCPSCGGEIVFYDTAFDADTGKIAPEFACGVCGSGLTKKELEPRLIQAPDPLDGSPCEAPRRVPVLIAYRIGSVKYEKAPDDSDLRVIDKVHGLASAAHAPAEFLPYRHMTHERNVMSKRGVRRFSDFWHERSRIALSFVWRTIDNERPATRDPLRFWVQQGFWTMSVMNAFRPAGYSQNSQHSKGFYHVPGLMAEVSLDYCIGRKKRNDLIKLWATANAATGQVAISTGSSTILSMSDESVDYVFVDPPFGENFYYADLNYLLERWHGVVTNALDDAIVSRSKRTPRSVLQYQAVMQECFAEFRRVLKPGRWMTVEFSNSKNAIWIAIQQALTAAGFVVADTRVIDKEMMSYRQATAKNAVKRDLVISCYRPSSNVEERFSLIAGTPEGAWEFVLEHLSHVPVAEGGRGEGGLVRERYADRLYDRMVAYHVHRSATVPLTAVEFYAGLEQRFPVRDDMYFLPEQVEAYERHRTTFRELAQLELFITNEASGVQWLRQLLKKKPLVYAEIQVLFFEEVQAGLASWEELPELQELLKASFLQDDEGRWFVPDPKKAADLDKARNQSLLREFEEYASEKKKLLSFRSEAVRAGFKDAWGRRDFAMIVGVGERLPADAFVEDEALLYYYDNARRLLPEGS